MGVVGYCFEHLGRKVAPRFDVDQDQAVDAFHQRLAEYRSLVASEMVVDHSSLAGLPVADVVYSQPEQLGAEEQLSDNVRLERNRTWVYIMASSGP